MDPYCHNKSTKVPGWDEFYGMCITAYYDVPWVTSEGNIEKTGSAPEECTIYARAKTHSPEMKNGFYSKAVLADTTSIIGNKTVDFIRRAALNPTVPFFVSAATRAPHGRYPQFATLGCTL